MLLTSEPFYVKNKMAIKIFPNVEAKQQLIKNVKNHIIDTEIKIKEAENKLLFGSQKNKTKVGKKNV